MSRISQREARRLRKLVADLERREANRARTWSSEWPGGVHLFGVTLQSDQIACLRTAQKLGHYLVVKVDSCGSTQFYASKVTA